MFILGQCLNVQHFEHVIWLRKVFVWLKRSLSGWRVLGQRLRGWRGWISPKRAHGQAAGCHGREHSLSHICVLPGAWTFTSGIFSSWAWAAELLWSLCSRSTRALASCLGPLGAERLLRYQSVNPASLGIPEHPFVGTGENWGRGTCQPPPHPHSFYPECAQSPPRNHRDNT